MQRRAITTLPIGIVLATISFSACVSLREFRALEKRFEPDDRVFIGIRGGKIDMVHPPVKEVCRPQRADCGEQIRWKVVGSIGDSKVHVEEKTGGNEGCFEPFDLDQDHREEVQSPSEECKESQGYWYYDVVLTDAGGTQLDKVDPLVLVSWSPGP